MTTPAQLVLAELSADPDVNPSAGQLGVFAKNDGSLYTIDSTGTTVQLGAGGGAVSSVELTSTGATVTISPTGPQTGAVSINVEASGGGSPGGSNTQVQFNNSGSFDGVNTLTFVAGVDAMLSVGGAGATSTAELDVLDSANGGISLMSNGGNGRLVLSSTSSNTWAITNNASTLQFTDLSTFATKLTITNSSVVVDAPFTASADVVLGSMGANNLGFFGSAGTSQQLVTFASASPTLTGVYATDVAALQAFNDAMYTAVQSIIAALEAYNLVTD